MTVKKSSTAKKRLQLRAEVLRHAEAIERAKDAKKRAQLSLQLLRGK